MAPTSSLPASVKVVGASGQISLGKQFAGRRVLIEEQEAGVWLIRLATAVPDNERWLHAPGAADDLGKALAWASAHAPSDATVDETFYRLSTVRAAKSTMNRD